LVPPAPNASPTRGLATMGLSFVAMPGLIPLCGWVLLI